MPWRPRGTGVAPPDRETRLLMLFVCKRWELLKQGIQAAWDRSAPAIAQQQVEILPDRQAAEDIV